MPFEFTWEPHGFYARLSGNVSLADIEAKNRRFSNDPRSDLCHYQIIDASGADAIEMPERAIKDMASNDIGMCAYKPKFAVCLVSSKPEIRETFSSYVALCLKRNVSWQFKICQTLEQARAWLNEAQEQRQVAPPRPMPPAIALLQDALAEPASRRAKP